MLLKSASEIAGPFQLYKLRGWTLGEQGSTGQGRAESSDREVEVVGLRRALRVDSSLFPSDWEGSLVLGGDEGPWGCGW